MNYSYSDIIQGLSADELCLNDRGKQAVKSCAELMLNTSVDFATATILGTLLMAHLKHVEPSEDFAENYEENRPSYYSSEVTYLSFFLLYLCEKVRNLSDILLENQPDNIATHFQINLAGDADVCDRCEDRQQHPIRVQDVAYDNVPPFHMGCRCQIIFVKEADENASQGA